jgi:hypothetical protein
MKTFRLGTVIDIDCKDEEIDQISRDQASDDDISNLSESEKNVFREDASFKARFTETVDRYESEAQGQYYVGTDLTPAQ